MHDPQRALKWDRRFLVLSDTIAAWSKDPSRGVGAVIVSQSRQIVATGFKGYLAQEFIPRRDPMTSLRESIDICDV